MITRRYLERPVRLIHFCRTNTSGRHSAETWRRDEYLIDPWAGSWAPATVGADSEPGSVAVLLEIGDEEALLLTPSGAAPVRVDVLRRFGEVMSLAAAAERDHRRELDRLRRCERFLVLADLLATARSRSDIFDSLVEHVPLIVGTWEALVLSRAAEDGAHARSALRVVAGDLHGMTVIELQPAPVLPVATVGLLERDPLPETGEPLSGLARAFFSRTPAVRLAWAAINGEAILVVIDRRSTSGPRPGDWDLLRVVTRQAAAALDRLA